jgi:DNA-binding transcriptional LysR family regulator
VDKLNLDLLSLRLFVSVVEEGTIAAAAEREHIAAAAVSKRISELEVLLGVQLLSRNNRGVTPTAAGISLLFKARSVLNDLAGIASQMEEFSGGRRGSVHVLANISAVSQFLPSLIKTFMVKHPEVQITLEERESLYITKAIAENIAEIGVFTRLPHGADIEVYSFRQDELVLAVPADHPLAARDSISFHETLGYEYVTLRSGTHLQFQMLKAASDVGKALKQKIAVSSYDALWLMVQEGVGIAILPRGTAEKYRGDHTRLVRLSEPWAQRELSICVRSLEALSPAARLFFHHLRRSDTSA